MITLGNHGSGDPTGSPDEGLYDPTPKTIALLPEGHNLLLGVPSELQELPRGDPFRLPPPGCEFLPLKEGKCATGVGPLPGGICKRARICGRARLVM